MFYKANLTNNYHKVSALSVPHTLLGVCVCGGGGGGGGEVNIFHKFSISVVMATNQIERFGQNLYVL